MFYMHLKYDHKLFRALFTGPLIIAVSTLIGLLFLFGKLVGAGRGAAESRCIRRSRCCCIRAARIVARPSSRCIPSTVIGLAGAGRAVPLARAASDRRLRAARRRPRPAPARARSSPALALIFLSLNGLLHDLSDSTCSARTWCSTSAHPRRAAAADVGTPGWMLRPLLALARRRRRSRAGVTRAARCFVIFNVVLAAWHLPPMYNTAMAHHPVHIVAAPHVHGGGGADVVAAPEPAARAAAARRIRGRCSTASC